MRQYEPRWAGLLVALRAVFETLETLADLGDLLVAYADHFVDTLGPRDEARDGFRAALDEAAMPSKAGIKTFKSLLHLRTHASLRLLDLRVQASSRVYDQSSQLLFQLLEFRGHAGF